ncbi:MAG: orotate phosphoribosyltransferase [Fidelibacterota bacterium]
MNPEDFILMFKKTGALLEGHFILTSGLHSATYFQCSKILQHPEYRELFSKIIAEHFRSKNVELVISPAMGGIVIGSAVGRELGVRSIFTERENGQMTLRRGFSISQGENVLVVEDVVTTGGSVKEVIEIVRKAGGNLTGVGVIVNRSGGKIHLTDDQYSVVQLDLVTYPEDQVPVELKQIPAIKPGSRSLK